jgi:hypothetical protein
VEHITSHFTAAVSTVYSSEKVLSKCLFSKLFEVTEKQSFTKNTGFHLSKIATRYFEKLFENGGKQSF